MSESVIDPLKVVEIDVQSCDFQVMFLGSGDCSRQVLLEQLSVGQAGQRIEIGQTVDSFFGPLTVCDFADNGKCQVIQVRHHLQLVMVFFCLIA